MSLQRSWASSGDMKLFLTTIYSSPVSSLTTVSFSPLALNAACPERYKTNLSWDLQAFLRVTPWSSSLGLDALPWFLFIYPNGESPALKSL